MSEFDDKLSAILGDQNAMSQIMALAQSLSGSEPDRESDEAQQRFCPQEIGDRGQDVQLLSALRPYLKERRQKKLDRALELLQLMRLLKGNRE